MPTKRLTRPEPPPRTCVLYTRISSDREGKRLGVERQREDLPLLAAREGLTVVEVYEDNDRTASKGLLRKDFERMLADGQAGRFGTIIAYTSGRLSREPYEKERLIQYSRETGIKMMYVNSPTVDLLTADGRRVQRILNAVDIGESETIGERVSREIVQRAVLGRFHGGPVPFGYRGTKVLVDAGSDRPKIHVHVEVDPVTSVMLQDAARRVLAEESLYSICAEWNAAGHKTQRGNRWRGPTLRNALITPSVAGLRLVGGAEFPVPWPAIIRREQWEELREFLTKEDRAFREPSEDAPSYVGKRPLNGIVRCSAEGHRMTAHMAHREIRLLCRECPRGNIISIKYDPLERWLLDRVWDVVDTPEFRRQVAQRSTTSGRGRKALRDELKNLQLRKKRLAESYEMGLRTRQDVEVQKIEIDRLEADAEARLKALGHVHVLEDVSTRKAYENADVTKQRAFLAGIIERVTISPFPLGECRTLPRRRGESEELVSLRRAEHDEEMLRRRVAIVWRA